MWLDSRRAWLGEVAERWWKGMPEAGRVGGRKTIRYLLDDNICVEFQSVLLTMRCSQLGSKRFLLPRSISYLYL